MGQLIIAVGNLKAGGHVQKLFVLVLFGFLLAACGQSPKEKSLAECRLDALKTFNYRMVPDVDDREDPRTFRFIQLCMQTKGYVFDFSSKLCDVQNYHENPACYQAVKPFWEKALW